MNDFEKLTHLKLTENGDISFDTTGNKMTDILFMTEYYQNHLDEVELDKSPLSELFAMFIRDPRFGLGRRDLGRKLQQLTELNPALSVLSGRFDDLLYNLTDEAISFWKSEIESGNELAKKWAPRLTGKDKVLAKKLAKAWGLSEKEYRKFIKCTTTVEHKLSYCEPAKSRTLTGSSELTHPLVDTIEFDKLPSLALMKYTNSFKNREDLKERFNKYLQEVKAGIKKINTSVTNIYDIYRNRLTIDPEIYLERLPNVTLNAIPILDTSGSMHDMNDSFGKATAIAYYIAKHSMFPNKVISFSSRPDLITINKEGSSYVRYKPYGVANDFCKELNSMYTGDCSNTDLGAVMRLLQNVNPKNLPEYLVVLSDMEFYRGSSREKNSLLREWRDAGINTKIVWWNFNSRNTTVPETDEWGNIFFSGYNPDLLSLLENNFDSKAFLAKLLTTYIEKISSIL